MATRHDAGSGRSVVLAKGAVERILELCASQLHADGSVGELDRARVMEAAEDLATGGLRVLATAHTEVDSTAPFASEDFGAPLVFTGLQAMLDPPRKAAIDAVRSCHQAGIDVKMITGDHASTATAIAAKLDILTEDDRGRVMAGADLAGLHADDYASAVERASAFARVSPEQKLRLVRGLQARGHVVAMTGDGVNDAPALQQADIGVAMGKGGTEVAKEAADIVLTDDDFATIEAAIEEGRGVFDNLTKFITWTLPTNLGEGFVILVAILLGATLPIVPLQILWINMTTAVALGLTLAFEPKEDNIMQRPPRDPRRPLLTGSLLVRTGLVSALLVGGSWWLFEWERDAGASIAEARTVAVNVFVAVEALYLFNCRSLSRSVWHVGLWTNRWMLGGLAVQTVGQAAITYAPPMQSLFETAPIGPGAWARILAVALAASAVVGIDKRLRRERTSPAQVAAIRARGDR
jgi:cation-transporting ATPase F